MKKQFCVRLNQQAYQQLEMAAQEKSMLPAQLARHLIESGLNKKTNDAKLMANSLANRLYHEKIIRKIFSSDEAECIIIEVRSQASGMTMSQI